MLFPVPPWLPILNRAAAVVLFWSFAGLGVWWRRVDRERQRLAERERSAPVLREREENLRLALQAARMVAWEWDLSSGRAKLSENASDFFPCASHDFEVEAKDGFSVIHPDDRPKLEAVIEKAVAERGSYQFVCRYNTPAGAPERWLEVHGCVGYDDANRPVKIRGVSQEITERKRAEEALRAQHTQLGVLAKVAGRLVMSDQPAELLGPVFKDLADELGFELYFNYMTGPVPRELELESSGGLSPELQLQYRFIPFGAYLCGYVAETGTPLVLEDLQHSDFEGSGPLKATGTQAYAGFPLIAHGRLLGTLAFGTSQRTSFTADELQLMKTLSDQVAAVLERGHLDRKLRESEERFRVLVETASQAVWETNREGKVVEDSPSWRAYTGQTVDEWVGHGWVDAVHPDERALAEKRWSDAVRDKTPVDSEFRLRSPGGWRWTNVRAAPILEPDGSVVKWTGMNLDISDRKAAEAALRESEERFRTLTDNIAQLVWMADASGGLVWYNKRWFDFTGAKLEELQGTGWQKVFHPDHAARVEQNFRLKMRAGEPFEDSFPLRGKDGTYRWFLCQAVPIHGENGEVLRWFGTNTDITAEREVELALKEGDRRKDEFLAMLAHELRNPLAPIRTAVKVLDMTEGNSPEAVRTREMIARQVAHMSRMIDDLLDVSRIARGKVELRKDRCDVVKIVRDVASDYRPSLDQGGIELSVVVPDEPLWVSGDHTRLSQIVGNLLHNAGKFTDAGGKVEVRVEADHTVNKAVVIVCDTGIGMEPSMLTRVFETFSQADRSLERSRGGLGLGLALVKGLVELHGGSVEAHSEGPGKGSRFTVRLPLSSARAVRNCPRPADRALQPVNGTMRVLVIEDNPDAANILKELLVLMGYSAEVAYAGPTGLEAARELRPDVVLCDLGLPGMDGFAVAKALRADPATLGTYLIAQTGYGKAEDRRRAREAGFDLHMTKPIDPTELERVLASVAARGSGSHRLPVQ
jgi:PAS domain S-box-containing protein